MIDMNFFFFLKDVFSVNAFVLHRCAKQDFSAM